MANDSGAAPVHLLADRPQLIGAVGEMRWREWGDEPGREELSWWVDITARESGKQGLPVTWVAVDEAGEAAGAVGQGYSRVWVATGDPAVGFYRRCGWEEAERFTSAWGTQTTVLTKRASPVTA